MTFTCKYRNAQGALETEVLEAGSRAEAFELLRGRGVVPIQVAEGGRSPAIARARKPSGGLLKGALAGILVVLAAVCAWLLLRPSGTVATPEPERPKSAKPAPAAPARLKAPAQRPAAPTNAAETAAVPMAVPAPPVPAPATNAVGNSRSPWADRPRRVIKSRPPEKPRLFRHNSENLIADMLEVEPGDSLIGELPFDWRFVEDFKRSLEEEIEILPTNSEYERKMKQAVIDTKAELKARMDAGEDVGEIMRAARAELQETGIYRDQLIQELHEIRRSGEWTADEYEKFVSAANAMLANKGAKPITVPRVLIRKLRLQDEKRKAARK
ncbi:MAG: hypothetical protein ACI4UY_13170 [Kiritimatiellia bacterium]